MEAARRWVAGFCFFPSEDGQVHPHVTFGFPFVGLRGTKITFLGFRLGGIWGRPFVEVLFRGLALARQRSACSIRKYGQQPQKRHLRADLGVKRACRDKDPLGILLFQVSELLQSMETEGDSLRQQTTVLFFRVPVSGLLQGHQTILSVPRFWDISTGQNHSNPSLNCWLHAVICLFEIIPWCSPAKLEPPPPPTPLFARLWPTFRQFAACPFGFPSNM